MSNELRISSFGEAQQLASEFDAASNNLQELITFTDRVGGELRGIWEGDSVENFMANYEEIKAALSKMVPLIADMKSDIDRKLEALMAANQ